MTTGTKIVQRALGEIGAHSPLQPAPPESLEAGKDTLNSMLSEWYDDGIEIGIVPLKKIGDELSEPSGVRNAIIYNLALHLAPDFPAAQVSSELIRQANKSYNKLERLWGTITIPNAVKRETYPMGQGNKTRILGDEIFTTEGDELG